jgi:antitoxin VapB
MHTATAKLFATGGSQAVRLPAEFRFEGAAEVYIWRDDATGDVILSTRAPSDWATFMQLRAQLGPVVPDDFLNPDEREQGGQMRDPFGALGE